MDRGKASDGTHQRKPASLSPDDAHLPREKLPPDLQKLVDNDESLIDQLYDGTYVPFYWDFLTFEAYQAIELQIQLILPCDTRPIWHVPAPSS